MKDNFSNYTDEQLMILFKNNSNDAFECLVDRYQSKIFHYIFRYVRNFNISQEITQEVFVRLYRSKERYEVKAKFSTYLYKIAVNLAFNEVRNIIRRKTDCYNDMNVPGNSDDNKKNYNKVFTEYNTPDKIYEKKEIIGIIRKEINNLTRKHKDVLILCDINGYSYRKTADTLNISIGTVQSRLSRGRMKLKRSLINVLK